jgi:drug/metabolite transporter (DMT)-like permease
VAPARVATLPRLLLLAAVVIWGWTFVATKVCLVHLDPLSLLAARFALAIPALLLLLRLRGARLAFGPRKRWLAAAAGIFLVHFTVQVLGLRYTTAMNSGWIIAVTPVVVAVLAGPLLGERLGAAAVLGMAVASAGIVLLVGGGPGGFRSPSVRGDLLVLATAFTWALYTVAVRKVLEAADSLAVTLGVVLPSALVLAVVAALRFRPRPWAALGLEGWLALAFLGLLGTAAAQWFWQVGVARVGAARAGTFLYLEPLATTALAVPYLGEPLLPATLAGGLLVLVGVALAQRGAGDEVTSAAPAE